MRLRALVVLVGLLASVASADEVVLVDGTRLEGEVVSMDARRVVLALPLGAGKGELSLERAQVASVSFADASTGAPPDAPAADPSAPATPGIDGDPLPATMAPDAPKPAPRAPGSRDRPRPGTKGTRTLFLLDRSGSMAIGERWKKATTWLCDRVGTLEAGSEIDVALFDERFEAVWGSWHDVTPHLVRRMPDVLEPFAPALRFGTNIDRALRGALERDCDRIILITDGVVTRGGADGAAKALERALEAARARDIRLDVVAVQDGAFHAPVEDLAAARALLERLSRCGRGVFLPLPAEEGAPPPAYHPLEGAGPAHEPRVEVDLTDVESRNTIVPKVLRMYPRFRVCIRDEVMLRGDALDVWEYGGACWLELRTLDATTGLPFDRLERIELVRDGERLWSELPFQVVGTEDHSYRSNTDTRREGKVIGNLGPPQTQVDDRYLKLQAREGAVIEVVYHRGAETFTERRFLRSPAQEVQPVGPGTTTPTRIVGR